MYNPEKIRVLNNHLFIIYILAIILVSIVSYYQLILGLLLAICIVVSFFYTFQREKATLNRTKSYISTLSHRIEKVGEEALLEMPIDRKSTRLNSSHVAISYAVFCLKKK